MDGGRLVEHMVREGNVTHAVVSVSLQEYLRGSIRR